MQEDGVNTVSDNHLRHGGSGYETSNSSDPSIWVRSSCEARSLLLIHRYKFTAWVRQICCEQLNFRRRMGGTKKLSKFIVDWEDGTRVAYNNGDRSRAGKCINFARLYLCNG